MARNMPSASTMSRALLLLLTALTASAQTVSIGAKVGLPMSYAVGNAGHVMPYLFGPSVEVALGRGFALDTSVLYRRAGANFVEATAPGATVRTQARTGTWQFPALAKHYFRRTGRRPPHLA